MTAEKDISVIRGDTRRHTFTFKDSSGSALDISAWTAFLLAVNSEQNPTDTQNQVGTISGIFVTDGTDGKVYFSPPGDWDAGVYFYDAQALDSNSEKITFVRGRYTIMQDRAKS